MNLTDHGVQIESAAVAPATLIDLRSDIGEGERGASGIRNAEKKFPTIGQLIESDAFNARVESVLGNDARVVRVILLDKTPERNWRVTWHQDRTIAVNKQMDIPGWGPWSRKDGIWHVQPDAGVLNKMITLRLHLDDANMDNGCLKVIPGSHKDGILTQEEIDVRVQKDRAVHCDASAGDLLMMRPHILHASAKCTTPSHRRVVHVEYSNYVLPAGLDWASA